MLSAFASIFLLLAGGILYRRLPGTVPAPEVRRAIGSVVLHLLMPALTFSVLYRAPIGRDLWAVPVVSLGTTVVCLSLAWLIYGRYGLGRRLAAPTTGALILASAWCNATYLGLPIVTTVVGPHVARVPILFDLLAMTPMLFLMAPVLGAAYGSTGHRPSWRSTAHTVVTLPPLLGAAAGFMANLLAIPIPTWLLDACDLAGRCVAPLMIVSVGLALGRPHWRRWPILGPALAVKLVVAPLIGLLLASVAITDTDVFRAVLLEAAMPTMMLTMIFSERYGLDTPMLAEAILASTALAAATVPLFAGYR